MHPDIAQQLNEIVDIADVGNVAYDDFIAGQQRRTDHLQRFVLGTLWGNSPFQQVSALYLECGHKYRECFLLFLFAFGIGGLLVGNVVKTEGLQVNLNPAAWLHLVVGTDRLYHRFCLLGHACH